MLNYVNAVLSSKKSYIEYAILRGPEMTHEVVLIVDDSKVVHTYFNQLMNPVEFTLLIASNAQEARKIVESEQKIDVAVVDINLPDSLDGEVVDYTIEHSIPTIVLTGSRSEDIRKQISSKKIIDYMQKSTKTDFANVVDLIRQLRSNRSTKVLIVDDSKTFLMNLNNLLLLHNFIVIEAENGQEALGKLEEFPDIAMVLTDYEMPVMDGLKLIHKIRKKNALYDLPIIVLSTHDDGYKIADCLKAGANDYIHKPYTTQEFFSRLYLNLNSSENMHHIKEQQMLLEQYKMAIDETSIVSKADIKGIITFVNDEFCKVSGYSREELIGSTHRVVRHPDTPVETFSDLWGKITNKNIWTGSIKNRKKNGESYIVDTTIVPILDSKNDIQEYISIRRDITQLIEQNTIIEKQYTDRLTKLPNRLKLIDELEHIKFSALVLVNIDSFNEINNFYGYEIADRLLILVADKIKEYAKNTHTVFKLPVDEYALLGENISEVEEKIFIEDMLKQISGTSFMIDDNEIFVHFSVGIYSGEKDHIINADIALQQARVLKKDICAYEDLPDINEIQFNNLKWVKKLHHAIVDERIKAFYQPIVNNKNEKIEKYESLVRMIDEDAKVISPFFFLDIAKKTKMYERLTRVVFDQTIVQAKKYKMPFSINLTVSDFKNTLLMEYIYKELKASGIVEYIVIEIVESEELESIELLQSVEYLKECGIKISIDDFGTGYSNFDYLIKLNVDFIKIDGSIIKNIIEDPNSELMAKTIVNLANQLGAKTIAEYVENEAIYKMVKELGVDYSQGYYFSEPLENIDNSQK